MAPRDDLREWKLAAGREPPPPSIPRAIRQELAIAYQRPCWICAQIGACCHREPEIELALAGYD